MHMSSDFQPTNKYIKKWQVKCILHHYLIVKVAVDKFKTIAFVYIFRAKNISMPHVDTVMLS